MLEYIYITFTLRDFPKELNERMKTIYYNIFDMVTKNICKQKIKMNSEGINKK